ncbi:alpha/beta hydrolase [Chryseosolibacter indicus]|uniref:Alpha/beta hydrolase n=1 Tax=Chryseosolibacter indicus TaxID=2782351 RepID=A0ABS5VP93_9BACT|nr:alpha/beta hydrolase [Chryseosolibacter indicus]MBT1703243.1 alpha/beta hydrolase [Chryseosolibacter indicus]
MTLSIRCIFIISLFGIQTSFGQLPERIKTIFPEGTAFHQNINYANDTLKKHLLDIYLPSNTKGNTPLIIWVHGGAWMLNDKYADMGYMRNTIRTFIEKGYALASIDYRYSTTAAFPAQIKDCIQAVEFLYTHADKYKLDKKRFAFIGFSAGGHLASLIGLSLNNNVKEFYPDGKKPSFQIKTVIDFYGPADLLMMSAKSNPEEKESISTLLGSSPLKRPDLARLASPSTYVDKNDPPFFIVNGEKDESVPYQQSIMLKSYLDLAGVKNDIIIVKDAPHYGVMFDTEEVRNKLFNFLDTHLR